MATTTNTTTNTTTAGTIATSFLGTFGLADQLKQALKDNDSKAVELTKKNAAKRAFAAQQYADLKSVQTADTKLEKFSDKKTTIGALGTGGNFNSQSLAAQFGVGLRA